MRHSYRHIFLSFFYAFNASICNLTADLDLSWILLCTSYDWKRDGSPE